MIAWTLAGNDSGGGAGIAADLRTFHGLGVIGCPIICALTAQNSHEVRRIEYPSTAMVAQQIEVLASDLKPRAIKTGMLGHEENVRIISELLKKLAVPIICDPVMVSSSGTRLMPPLAKEAMLERFFPLVHLLTPNLREAEDLLGEPLTTAAAIEDAAKKLRALGPQAVLIKGGHGTGPLSQDFYDDGKQRFWLNSPRIDTEHSHGTGCTLASAIAAALALDYALPDAVVIAKAYLNQGLSLSRPGGHGPGSVFQGGWPHRQEWLPWLTETAPEKDHRLQFPSTGPKPLGFYPLIDGSEWLERLIALGVSTVQLRIKHLKGSELDREIAKCIALAKTHQCRLFINDYWELAIKHGAYGVHLGQEDLADANLEALAQAGLRLGVSTHGFAEVARALAMRPSYIALGPIFTTRSKDLASAPQGVERLAHWCQTLDIPLVAIGGIQLDHLESIIAAGADGVAVISALTNAVNPDAAVKEWLSPWL